ncbi:methyl-accepting chemotaxis protein [Uliginosibacterium sp. sgz301328]|uniref:methyl-accepting chemotaxis protein n=1 Tax=Uliginosibacterium sp. sgz301328 TaxID=3243764 RepID=UPI00359CBE11
MKALFSPAVALLNRLRYPYKFGLIGLVAVVSIGFFVVSLTIAMQSELSAARAERDGLSVYQPALRALQVMQHHSVVATAAQSGDDTFKSDVQARAGEVDAALAEVDKALAASSLNLAAPWKAVQAEWQQVKGKTAATQGKDIATLHAKLFGLMGDFLRDIGEVSNLISDASPDANYLADTLVRKMPDATDRANRLRGSGLFLIVTKDMATEWRKIGGHISEVERTRSELLDSLNRAANASRTAREALQATGKALGGAYDSFLAEADAELLKGALAVEPKAYTTHSAAMVDTLFSQADKQIVPTLRAVLDARIGELNRAFITNTVIAAVMVLLLAYFSVAMFFAILGSVSELSEGARRIGDGELSYRIPFSAKDELRAVADQFNAMSSSFAEVIQRVQSTAQELNQSATALAGSAEQVSKGSERQSEAASSMAAAVEEMTVGIDEISRHAASAEEVASHSGTLSTTGGEVVQSTVSEMERIAEAVNQSATVIEELGQNSAQISSIVNSIKEIADQTNLLALNAAIEAARAGESGRGFAVVADEVRKLAERTARATQEIGGMVAAIQSGTNRAVSAMQDGVTRVREGVQLTNQAGESMMRIRDESGRVVQSVSDISLALREQTSASTEIARNVEHIARMADENNAAVAETAQTANRLESLAHQLTTEVARFRL